MYNICVRKLTYVKTFDSDVQKLSAELGISL